MEMKRRGRHVLFTTKGTKATKKNPRTDGGVRRWDSLPGLSLVPLVTLVVNDFDLAVPLHLHVTAVKTRIPP